MTHWCRDIPRDEAVRAAEDGRPGPLPTLEECIGLLPKTGSALSKVEHENKGNDMAANGLQTAEMTLEVVYDPGWLDSFEVIGDKVLRLVRKGLGKAAGESVRLVDLPLPFAAVIFERNEARDERDAAIKRAEAAELLCESQKDMMAHYVERIEALHLRCKLRHSAVKQAKARVAELEAERDNRATIDEVAHQRDTLQARVSRLEEQLESVADRAAAAETALEAAPAASGAAGTGHVISEVLAWGVMVDREAEVLCVPFTVREAADHFVRLNGVNETMTVVPLCAAPHPENWFAAVGWLTAEERRLIEGMMEWASVFSPTMHWHSGCTVRDTLRILQSLLARSSPPEVVLGECPFTPGSTHAMGWWEAIGKVRTAIAAAGVKVKEVE